MQEKVEMTTEELAEIEQDVMQLAIENRRSVADGVVKNHIISSIAFGLVPIPLFDLAALTTTQINMLRSLSDCYGLPPSDTDIKPLVTSLITGSLPVLGVVGLSSFVKVIPGIGSLAGSASLGISAGAVTYAVGQTFIMHFENGGTLEDFEPGAAKAFFKSKFDAGKSLVKEIRDELKASKEGDAETEGAGNEAPEPEQSAAATKPAADQ